MTFAELKRAFASYNRRKINQEKEQASFDYILADLIGRSVSRIYHANNKLPALYDAYPSLFDKEIEEERLQKKRDELSIARFKQFAQLANTRFKEGEIKHDE